MNDPDILFRFPSVADTIAASKTLSEATTLDVSSNIGLEFPDSQIPQHDNLKISQGKATYEAYVNASESFVRAAVRQTEIRAVKAVLTGLKQAFRRKEILKVLEEKGCFWSIAKQELQKIVDEGKRRRATRRTVHLAPLKDLETSSSRPTDPSSELLGGQ